MSLLSLLINLMGLCWKKCN